MTHMLTIEDDSSPLERILSRGDPLHVVNTSQQMRGLLRQVIAGVMELPADLRPSELIYPGEDTTPSAAAAPLPTPSSSLAAPDATPTAMPVVASVSESSNAKEGADEDGAQASVLLLGVGACALALATGAAAYFLLSRKQK
jgi:hypothetical protein